MALTPTPATPEKREYLESKLNRELNKAFYNEDGYWIERERALPQLSVVTAAPRRAAHRKEQRGASARSSKKSGDGNSEPEPEPERRQPLSLYDQASLADLLQISKKTLQNLYSATPWLLPPAIAIPGARGPRWTPASVQAWLNERPAYTSKPAPKTNKKNKVGRPRLALRSVGGAA